MSGLFAKAVDAILSQAGLVAFLLICALVYQTWQLALARADREKDRETARQEALERVEAFDRIADALSTLSVTVARLEGRIKA